MFFRLIGALVDLFIPAFLIVEVLVPLWGSKPMFPFCRKVAMLALRGLATSKPHIRGAEARRKNAEERLAAARQDREAALLERRSEAIEDETNDIRSGNK